MKVFNYNQEANDNRLTVYLRGIFFGVIMALLFIVLFLGLKFLLEIIIKNWIIVLVFIVGGIIIKKVFLKHGRKQ